MSTAVSRRDKLIPWCFVAFFAVIALVDGVMVTIAVKTKTGIVREHAYEEGLQYNKIITASQTQAALGFAGDIAFASTGKQRGTITFSLRDKQGKALAATPVMLNISRPTQDGHDQRILMESSTGGSYRAAVMFPLPGQWEVRVFATTERGEYQQSKRFSVP
jgi:nitrogen fixation protein FixH